MKGEAIGVKKGIDLSLFKRLLHYLYPFCTPLALSLLLLVAAKILEALIPLLLGEMTNRILESSPEKLDSLYHSLVESGAVILALIATSCLLEVVNLFIRGSVGQKALLSLRCDIYDRIISLPISSYDKGSIGTFMTRTIHDVDQISQMFTESAVAIFGNAILFVAIFAAVSWIDWRVAIALAAISPFVAYFTNDFRLSQRRSYSHIRTAVAAMNGFVQEELLGISLIKKFGLIDEEREKFSAINSDLKSGYIQSIKNFSLFISGVDFAMTSFIAIAFTLLVLYAPEGGFQGGTYLSLSLYSLMIFRPLADIADRYNVLQSAFAAGERIFSLMNSPGEELDSGGEELGEIQSIAFDDVWFAYKNEEWVLRGLSFTIEAGRSTALVGTTGAGKSTIVSLLLRFYDIQKGSIAINGKAIEHYSKRSLRKQFSLVLQDPLIMSGTVRDNITLNDPSIGREAVEAAIDYTGLREKVDRWEGGIDHLLAERGKNLSLGEMQLISMARAAVERRSVVILDEATASVDSKTEELVQNTLKKIIRDRTSIIIAHRLSTIRDVDTILVISNGCVAEKGTHKSLLEKKGIYEKLYRLHSL